MAATLLARWPKRPAIGDYALGVLTAHTKLRHGRSRAVAIAPDAGGQKPDYVSIAAAGRTSDSGRLNRPVSCWPGRHEPYRRSFEPLTTLEISCAVARGMTLATDGHVFDNVPPAIDQGGVGIASWMIVRLLSGLRPALVSQSRNQKKCQDKCNCRQ